MALFSIDLTEAMNFQRVFTLYYYLVRSRMNTEWRGYVHFFISPPYWNCWR